MGWHSCCSIELLMARRFPRITWAIGIGLVYLLVPGSLKAGTPMEELRLAAEKMLTVLKDPRLKSDARREERRQKLKATLYPNFDFREMAKRSLGPDWQRRTAQERNEFVKGFADLLEASYSDKLESYNGQKIVFTREHVDADISEIGSKIVAGKGEVFSVDYRLHRADGRWKIYDVVIENVSLVNNYRTQFHRVLAHSSFEDLLDRMRKRRLDTMAKAGDRREKLQLLAIFSASGLRRGP